MKYTLILFISCFFSVSVFAQQTDSTEVTTDSSKLFRKKNFIVLPVAFRLPETRFGGGIVASGAFSFARDSVGAKPSQASFGVTYTQNKQVLIFFPFNIFLKNNKWFLNGDTGWYKYNYFYFGVGENQVPEELFDVTFPRIRILAAKQFRKYNYIGLRFQFENYDVTNTEAGGELASGRISGSEYSRTSSLGVSFLRDTRDNVLYPRKGIFGEAFILPTSKVFGADREFTQLSANLAWYKSLSPKTVLATNYIGSVLIGENVPFSQLSFLGSSRSMRGLYEGYFRDKNTMVLQGEIRQDIWRFIGLVGFGGVGWMGNENDFLRLSKPKFTYGGGLRIATKAQLRLRIDYGLSPYQGGNIYATIGEAF